MMKSEVLENVRYIYKVTFILSKVFEITYHILEGKI